MLAQLRSPPDASLRSILGVIYFLSKFLVTIQRNKSAFDSVGRSLSGAEAMFLAK